MRILWVKTNLLHPLDSGGTIRSFQMLKHLREEHDVTYVTLRAPEDGRSDEEADLYCRRLVEVPWRGAPPRSDPRFYLQALANLGTSWPLALDRYRVPALGEKVRELTAGGAFDVAVSDFLFAAPAFRGVEDTPTLLFQHNVETLIWERMAEAGGLLAPYYRSQARRMARWEERLSRRFDLVVAVSEEDAALFRGRFGLPRVEAVPTGVDVDYFEPDGSGTGEEDHLVFVGSLDWLPNVDAVEWLLAEIWPRVRGNRPAASLQIVGRRPAQRIRRAVQEAAGVSLHPDVPDVRPYLREAAAVVVPLRVGGGTRLKIFEALAAGKAVVTTPVGAEGLPVADGEHLLLAGDAGSFADRVVELLASPETRRTLGRSGRRLVEERFSWRRAAHRFAELCSEAGRLAEAEAA